MGIKWDKNNTQRLRKVVASYNKKAVAINKKAGKTVMKRTSISGVKSTVMKTSELNRELKRLESLAKGSSRLITNKKGVTLTKAQWDSLKTGLTYAKGARTKRLKREASKPDNQYKEGFKTDRYEQLAEGRRALDRYDDFENMDLKKLERLEGAIRSETKRSFYTKRFYDRFLKQMTESRDLYEVDPLLMDKLKQELQDLDPEAFLQIYNETRELKSLMEYSYPEYETISKHKTRKQVIPAQQFNDIINQFRENLPSYKKDFA